MSQEMDPRTNPTIRARIDSLLDSTIKDSSEAIARDRERTLSRPATEKDINRIATVGLLNDVRKLIEETRNDRDEQRKKLSAIRDLLIEQQVAIDHLCDRVTAQEELLLAAKDLDGSMHSIRVTLDALPTTMAQISTVLLRASQEIARHATAFCAKEKPHEPG